MRKKRTIVSILDKGVCIPCKVLPFIPELHFSIFDGKMILRIYYSFKILNWENKKKLTLYVFKK